MEFKTKLGNFVVKDVGVKEDDWVVVKSQSVTFDKNDYFIREFNKDFPNFELLGSSSFEKFTFLAEACARSPIMREWFAATSVKYSDTTQLPLYLKDKVAPSDYKKYVAKILDIKDELSQIVKSRNELAKAYNESLKQLKAEEDDIISRSIGQDNVLKILFLNTESLPFSIQLKIQGYEPKNANIDVATSKRRLAQEYLVQFKTGLLDLVREKPDIDLDSVLSEVAVK
jgi:hypothetical protein